ncbi:MAG: ribulose-phosphate 3-epimerase [Thermoanaerobaculia bacterium]
MIEIAPSIIAADYTDLAAGLRACEEGSADFVHVDVMDGHFVPNLTIGPPVVAALAKKSRVPLDLHLMVANPDRLLDDYLASGVTRVAVHWEAAPHLDRLLARIRQAGVRAGVALNPASPVEWLTDILPACDYVLLMSVNPGWSGQPFLPYVLDKARRLHEHIVARRLGTTLEIDGGIGPENVRAAVEAGIRTIVAGSSVFGSDDPVAAQRRLRALAEGER